MNVVSSLKPYSLFLLVFLLAFSCDEKAEDDTRIIKMRVNHYVQPCSSYELQFCPLMLVQEGKAIGSDEWEQLHGIAGFDFQLGYTYDLIVEKKDAKKLSKPYPDYVARPSYTLKETVIKAKVSADETFELRLLYFYVDKNENSDFSINDGATRIECGSLCDELAEKIDNQLLFTGVFKHVDDNTILLVEVKE